MQIEIDEKSENRITLKIYNEDDTLCNIIVKHLIKKENIDFIAYKKKHFTDDFVFITLEINKGNFSETLISGVDEIINILEKNIII